MSGTKMGRFTRHLKEVVEAWLSELENDGIPEISALSQRPASFFLKVERRLLFQDARNHIPSSLRVFELWDEFKQQRRLIDDGRADVFQRVSDYLRAQTGHNILPVLRTHEADFGIFHVCVAWICECVIEKARDGSTRPLPQLFVDADGDGFVLVRGRTEAWARGPSEQTMHDFEAFLACAVENVSQERDNTAEHELVSLARTLLQQVANLHNTRNQLIEAMKNTMAIPILTGDCEHIRRAKEPLFPEWIPSCTGRRALSQVVPKTVWQWTLRTAGLILIAMGAWAVLWLSYHKEVIADSSWDPTILGLGIAIFAMGLSFLAQSRE